MEKLQDFLSNIPKDKLLHFFYGTFVGFILVCFFGWAGILLSLFVAISKEVVDYYRYQKTDREFNSTESLLDIVFTTIPSFLFYFS